MLVSHSKALYNYDFIAVFQYVRRAKLENASANETDGALDLTPGYYCNANSCHKIHVFNYFLVQFYAIAVSTIKLTWIAAHRFSNVVHTNHLAIRCIWICLYVVPCFAVVGSTLVACILNNSTELVARRNSA